MTCFWDGILSSLTRENFAQYQVPRPANYLNLIRFLKSQNTATNESNIKWNNQLISKQSHNENYNAIKEYDEKTATNGYLCSTCEPFLILVCHLFHVNIDHVYCGNTMTYRINNAKHTLKYKSNRGHFSNISN